MAKGASCATRMRDSTERKISPVDEFAQKKRAYAVKHKPLILGCFHTTYLVGGTGFEPVTPAV